MSTFILVASLMAALAAAAVAVPLCREPRSRWVGVISAVAIMIVAAGLYSLWSTWNWKAGAQQAMMTEEVQQIVAKLEKHLHEQPNDAVAWVMLGRTYLAMERIDDAVTAYDHAHRLAADNADAALGLGEALSLQAGGSITPQASMLFEASLRLQPGNAKALLYGGFAAAARGDNATARARWQALKELHPPKPIEAMLDARIAALDKRADDAGAARPEETDGAAASDAGRGSSGPATTDAEHARVSIKVTLAPALAARVARETALFVFAREPGVAGPPLAVKRLTTAVLDTQVDLSASDSMMAGRVLKAGQRVSIVARVSFSGQPLPATGDLYGELTYDVGRDGVKDLIIDRAE